MIAMAGQAPGKLILQFIISFVLLVRHADGKYQSGLMSISTGRHEEPLWHFVGKFGYAIGMGSYQIRFRMREPLMHYEAAPDLDLDVYLDEDWSRAESLPVCSRASEGPARRTSRVRDIGTDGQWGSWLEGSLTQNVRPHIWYFTITNCHRIRGGEPKDQEIEYEIQWRQFDKSEFSIDLRYMPHATFLCLACLTALLAHFAAKMQAIRRSLGSLHPVVRTLILAVIAQWTSQVMHLVHLTSYSTNGVGLAAFDTLADVLFMTSQVVCASLIIAIARGYALSRTRTSDVGKVAPILAAVALLHVILVALGKNDEEHSEKHHENEGPLGWVLVGTRIGLFVWFWSSVRQLELRGGPKLQCFLQHFKLAGSGYFASFPVIYVLTQLFAPYLQHPVLQTGQLIVQTVATLWLGELFLTRGTFFEVSDLGSSLLPCQGRGSCHRTMLIRKED